MPPDPAASRGEDTFTPTTSPPPPLLEGSASGPRTGAPPPDVDPGARVSRLSIVGMRKSLLSIQLPAWKPRWQPWSPTRVARTAFVFASLMTVLVVLTHRVSKRFAWKMPFTKTAAAALDEPVVTPSDQALPRADAALVREGRSPIMGGLLTLPPAFRSDDGAYDLVIHFHGNTDLVEESFAGVPAVVVIMNYGNGSGVYEDRFGNAFALPEVVHRVQTTMEKRGLAHARLRRLALTAWSAGYGAVLKILEQPTLADTVDAVVLLDGIHVGYQPQGNELIMERLAPFERFGRAALEGKKLFSITHSRIVPIGHYAGTQETTDALLRQLGVTRTPGGEPAPLPVMHSIEGVIAKKKLLALQPVSTVAQGGLHVRGYEGDQPEHHIAHLVEMSITALPDLVAWWKLPR